MKKYTLLLLVVGTFSYAQIKLNQAPTLDKSSNAFLDASENTEGKPNIGRGLLFPQTDLSKFTLDVASADGINYPTYFDGMIVYNTQEGGRTNDPSLAVQTENLTKGFYYFSNPKGKNNQSISEGKWVKLGDEKANNGLWGQRYSDGVTETYLKPALDKGDLIAYKSDRSIYKNLGKLEFTKHYWGNGLIVNLEKEVPDLFAISSDILKESSNIASGDPIKTSNLFYFSTNAYEIKNNHTLKNSNVPKSYAGKEFRLFTDTDVSGNVKELRSLVGSSTANLNKKLVSVSGVDGVAEAGTRLGRTAPNVDVVSGVRGFASSFTGSTVRNLTGVEGVALPYKSTNTTISGIKGIAMSGNKVMYDKIDGGSYPVTKIDGISGVIAHASMLSNATSKLAFAIDSKLEFLDRSKSDLAYGVRAHLKFGQNTSVKDVNGLEIFVEGGSKPVSIENLYALKYVKRNTTKAFNPKNMYGLFLENVENGSEKNYAIYTNAGKVRFGDNVGIGVDAPREKLEVNGNVKAASYLGLNGRRLFPDYVFEDYYKGKSTIKTDYKFKTLSQVEDFVKQNGHLPGYASAKKIQEQGYVDLMETQLTNVEKIEELYLHSIEQEKALKAKDAKIQELELRLAKLEALLSK
ncbi:hypothetical protein [Ornithobacterium rhinotracheale]|uniref:hypothetical protein n=1 Tax=Ornithobacterium rhinotracheale TaxID=28251 RepID=UPI001FF21A37|nr:hypothetical protein [Ornithobacterium rhinotracheale]MCK0205574.1 hypothetical protein [Ornithobacterium rhinotracheale]